MFRQYEDPYKIQGWLDEAEERLAENPDDYDLYLEVQELRDRLRFAWEDDEYDSQYADYEDLKMYEALMEDDDELCC